jgi:manganese oxidase
MKAIWLVLAAAAVGGKAHYNSAIDIRSFGYRESVVVVPVGTRVTWSNRDAVEHTVTSGTSSTADGQFTGSLSGAGATFSYTFERAGTYPYFCDRHHFMRGEIRVTPEKEGAR